MPDNKYIPWTSSSEGSFCLGELEIQCCYDTHYIECDGIHEHNGPHFCEAWDGNFVTFEKN